MINFRLIQCSDNVAMAKIIRDALTEFGANKPGTVYFDQTTDDLYSLFQKPKSRYFVAEENHVLIGGGGIYPTDGLDNDTCELVKMYLLKEARGKGIGKTLIDMAMNAAKEEGFGKVYLESMPELQKALHIYETYGFKYLDSPMGNTGHNGCNKWMLLELS